MAFTGVFQSNSSVSSRICLFRPLGKDSRMSACMSAWGHEQATLKSGALQTACTATESRVFEVSLVHRVGAWRSEAALAEIEIWRADAAQDHGALALADW